MAQPPATFAESGGTPDSTPTDGTITVSTDATVTVTNTYPGAEVLPASGNTGLRERLTVAFALVAVGSLMILFWRRKRTAR